MEAVVGDQKQHFAIRIFPRKSNFTCDEYEETDSIAVDWQGNHFCNGKLLSASNFGKGQAFTDDGDTAVNLHLPTSPVPSPDSRLSSVVLSKHFGEKDKGKKTLLIFGSSKRVEPYVSTEFNRWHYVEFETEVDSCVVSLEHRLSRSHRIFALATHPASVLPTILALGATSVPLPLQTGSSRPSSSRHGSGSSTGPITASVVSSKSTKGSRGKRKIDAVTASPVLANTTPVLTATPITAQVANGGLHPVSLGTKKHAPLHASPVTTATTILPFKGGRQPVRTATMASALYEDMNKGGPPPLPQSYVMRQGGPQDGSSQPTTKTFHQSGPQGPYYATPTGGSHQNDARGLRHDQQYTPHAHPQNQYYAVPLPHVSNQRRDTGNPQMVMVSQMDPHSHGGGSGGGRGNNGGASHHHFPSSSPSPSSSLSQSQQSGIPQQGNNRSMGGPSPHGAQYGYNPNQQYQHLNFSQPQQAPLMSMSNSSQSMSGGGGGGSGGATDRDPSRPPTAQDSQDQQQSSPTRGGGGQDRDFA